MNNPNPWKPDPKDKRVPIGAPDTSVEGGGAIGICAAASIPHEPRKHAQHMRVTRLAERHIGQLHGPLKNEARFVFGHDRIVRGGRGDFHSYFPRRVAMSLFFSTPVTTTDKRFCQ